MLPLSAADPTLTSCRLLLDHYCRAGVDRVVVVIRPGKWDIPAALATYSGVDVAYRVVGPTGSVPETLATALPFAHGAAVLLGFPDILYAPGDAFAKVATELAASEADVVLGLFPTDRPEKSDMVELAADGTVRRFWIKSRRRDLELSWGLAAWRPSFSALLAESVGRVGDAGDLGPGSASLRRPRHSRVRELWIGDLLQEAVDRGMAVRTVTFPDGLLLDIGTPDDLARARRLVAGDDSPLGG